MFIQRKNTKCRFKLLACRQCSDIYFCMSNVYFVVFRFRFRQDSDLFGFNRSDEICSTLLMSLCHFREIRVAFNTEVQSKVETGQLWALWVWMKCKIFCPACSPDAPARRWASCVTVPWCSAWCCSSPCCCTCCCRPPSDRATPSRLWPCRGHRGSSRLLRPPPTSPSERDRSPATRRSSSERPCLWTRRGDRSYPGMVWSCDLCMCCKWYSK